MRYITSHGNVLPPTIGIIPWLFASYTNTLIPPIYTWHKIHIHTLARTNTICPNYLLKNNNNLKKNSNITQICMWDRIRNHACILNSFHDLICTHIFLIVFLGLHKWQKIYSSEHKYQHFYLIFFFFNWTVTIC